MMRGSVEVCVFVCEEGVQQQQQQMLERAAVINTTTRALHTFTVSTRLTEKVDRQ